MIRTQDLTSRLVSANERVEVARSAALESDLELEEKELLLEESMKALAVEKDVRQNAEKELRKLKIRMGGSGTKSESSEELFRDMEPLVNEKTEAEARLDQELASRNCFEKELKRATTPYRVYDYTHSRAMQQQLTSMHERTKHVTASGV